MKRNVKDFFGGNTAFGKAIREGAGNVDFENMCDVEYAEVQTDVVREACSITGELYLANEELINTEIRENATEEEVLGCIREAVFGENGWLAKIWRMIKSLWNKAVKAVKAFFAKMFGKSSSLRKKFAVLQSDVDVIDTNGFDNLDANSKLRVKRSAASYTGIATVLTSFGDPDTYGELVALVIDNIKTAEDLTNASTLDEAKKGITAFKTLIGGSITEKKLDQKVLKEVYKGALKRSEMPADFKLKEDDFDLSKFAGAAKFATTLLERDEIMKEELTGMATIKRWYDEVKKAPMDSLEATFKIDVNSNKFTEADEVISAVADGVPDLKVRAADASNNNQAVTEESLKEVKEVSSDFSKISSIMALSLQNGTLLANKLMTIVVNELLSTSKSLVALTKK